MQRALPLQAGSFSRFLLKRRVLSLGHLLRQP